MITKIVFFLVTIITTNSLSCISPVQLRFPIPFNATEFESILNILSLSLSNLTSCSVEFIANYTQNCLWLKFNNATAKTMNVRVNYPKLTTTFSLFLDQPTVNSVIAYSCEHTDGCDRDFALIRWLWLLDRNDTVVQTILTDILVKTNEQSGSCVKKYFNSGILKCPTKMCFASGAIYLQPLLFDLGFLGGCESKKINSSSVQISIDLSSFTYGYGYNKFYSLSYVCGYNQCNNKTIFEKVANTIEDCYDIWNVFDDNNKENQKASAETFFNESFSTIKSEKCLSIAEAIWNRMKSQSTRPIPMQYNTSISSSSSGSGSRRNIHYWFILYYLFFSLSLIDNNQTK